MARVNVRLEGVRLNDGNGNFAGDEGAEYNLGDFRFVELAWGWMSLWIDDPEAKPEDDAMPVERYLIDCQPERNPNHVLIYAIGDIDNDNWILAARRLSVIEA